MSATIVHTPATIGNTREDSVMIAEDLEMKAEMGETRVPRFKVLGNSISTRIFRVVALGALLVGAAVLYPSISQGEADSQPDSNQTGPVSPATANLTSTDQDIAELPYDELSKNFFGRPTTTK